MTSTKVPAPTERVLVYFHEDAVSNGNNPRIIPYKELEQILALDPRKKITHKPLPKGARHIDIFQRDLWTEEEKNAAGDTPNAGLNLAEIDIGFRHAVARFLGRVEGLFIVSGM